jgi:hypothetical protein
MSRCTLRVGFPRAWFRGRALRSRLVLLVLATLLPLVLFAASLILLFAHEARRTTEQGMQDTARALALAMDREVAKSPRGARGARAVSSARCRRPRGLLSAVPGGLTGAAARRLAGAQ